MIKFSTPLFISKLLIHTFFMLANFVKTKSPNYKGRWKNIRFEEKTFIYS